MIGLILASALFIVLLTGVFGQPLGGTLTVGESSRGPNLTVGSTEAQAGNVTALNIDQTRVTDIWQGFFGNVSGEILLENADGDQFYDWSLSDVEGEIFASRNLVNDWSQVNCSNQTQIYIEEETLSITNATNDGVNDTYDIVSHPDFLVGSRLMTGCRSTRPYNSTGSAGQFWNVLLSTNSSNVVYTSIIADNSNGFDNSTVDFEILVPVDRLQGTSTYYFYAELN